MKNIGTGKRVYRFVRFPQLRFHFRPERTLIFDPLPDAHPAQRHQYESAIGIKFRTGATGRRAIFDNRSAQYQATAQCNASAVTLALLSPCSREIPTPDYGLMTAIVGTRAIWPKIR
jgi:hypothetical protein